MTEPGLIPFLIAPLASAFLVCSILWLIRRLQQREMAPPPPSDSAPDRTAIYLFNAGVLTDANTTALEIVTQHENPEFGWHDLTEQLANRFPSFPTSQGTENGNSSTVLRARDPSDPAVVIIDQWGNTARVTLEHSANYEASLESPTWKAIFDAPNPIWQTDKEGTITWRNAAYDALAGKLERSGTQDCATIFEFDPNTQSGEPVRTAVTNLANDRTYWFDVAKVISEDRIMHYATDANAIVNAEIAQRNFVQTLTKTFAQLSIGLAIFDRNRQLALFNPALIDLTVLPADFLSSRPSLLSFFDCLREKRVMPEPKNYASWREQIAELVVAASDGRYAETWTLPSGLTYRVTGRPHPDGAIAFLFEDISAEISLTRRFRSDVELGHSVIDALESAVAVFSSTGELRICNSAYRALWLSDPDTSIAEYTLRDALPLWKSHARQSDIWQKLQHAIMSNENRSEWSEPVTLKSGTQLNIRIIPLGQGATMVKFCAANVSGYAAPTPVPAD
ncbi:PAS-domain containing protein [Shimia sp.]|uniref:PAS-domain containing protein n=1 Tax=Shimia sp. TaxID=1954381 RepID=UPI00329A02D5